MAVYEGRWDCKRCGRTGNRGSARVCTGCGAPRPVDVEFYLREDAPAVTAEAELREALAGPDWGCRHCAAANRALDDYCGSCGAPRSANSPVAPLDDHVLRPVAPLFPGQARVRRADRTIGCAGGGIILLIGLLLVCLGGAQIVGSRASLAFQPTATPFFTPVPTATPRPDRVISATVTQRSWERTIAVEQRSIETGEGWDLPAGARVKTQSTRVRTTRQVIDRYETRTRTRTERVRTGSESYRCGREKLGNGYYRDKTCTRAVYSDRTVSETYREPIYRSEPVMGTWYSYEQDRWTVVRTAQASGSDDPAWPAVTLAANEREGQRAEHYLVRFEGANERAYTWECDPAVWANLREGQSYRLRISAAGVPLRLEQ